MSHYDYYNDYEPPEAKKERHRAYEAAVSDIERVSVHFSGDFRPGYPTNAVCRLCGVAIDYVPVQRVTSVNLHTQWHEKIDRALYADPISPESAARAGALLGKFRRKS